VTGVREQSETSRPERTDKFNQEYYARNGEDGGKHPT
jgi:hypothetical protein